MKSKDLESPDSPKVSNSVDSDSNEEVKNPLLTPGVSLFEKNSEEKNSELPNSNYNKKNPILKLIEKNTETSELSVPTGGNNRVKRQLPYSRISKKQVCNSCGEIFENRCLLTLHLMEHKKKTHPFQCQIKGCFQCYDSKLKFKSHLTRVHRDLNSEDVENLLSGKGINLNNSKNLNTSENSKNSATESDLVSSENKLTKIVEKMIKSEIVEK